MLWGDRIELVRLQSLNMHPNTLAKVSNSHTEKILCLGKGLSSNTDQSIANDCSHPNVNHIYHCVNNANRHVNLGNDVNVNWDNRVNWSTKTYQTHGIYKTRMKQAFTV